MIDLARVDARRLPPLKPSSVVKMTIVLAALALPACASVPVDRPCGVIRDSLKTVVATTPAGQQRLDVHFERGVAANCWGR